MARLQPEQDNLRAALQWTINEARYADAVWLLIAAGWFWNLCGNRYEKGRWIAQLLPYRDQLEVDLRLQILGSLHSVADAWAEIYTLWNAEPGSAEADQLDVLMLLVEDYEKQHYPIDPPDPIDLILFVMDANGLKQKDMLPYFGTRARASEILNRRRPLTL